MANTNIETKETVASIREAVFASSNFETVVIEMFGSKVEVKQPSINQLMALTEDGEGTARNAAVNAMVEFCYLPGTDQKIFTKEDYKSLLELPMGSWFVTFQEVWAKLASIDVGEEEKN